MTHASIFSGIGGFDLAAEWAGWTNMFNCEIDDFCRNILNYHFPTDIRTTDFTVWRGLIDVLTGGFPCQPFSVAGKRLGTEDERHLWPEMLRAIREIRPAWVVGENVFGIVNWSDGLVFEQVCADLENEGYSLQPFILPACAVDAPHRRDRVWIVAYRSDAGTDNSRGERFRTDSPPTPTASCGKTGTYMPGKSRNAERMRMGALNNYVARQVGKNSRLSPQFVAEMMGFPPDWTALPFRPGADNPSKPTEML